MDELIEARLCAQEAAVETGYKRPAIQRRVYSVQLRSTGQWYSYPQWRRSADQLWQHYHDRNRAYLWFATEGAAILFIERKAR